MTPGMTSTFSRFFRCRSVCGRMRERKTTGRVNASEPPNCVRHPRISLCNASAGDVAVAVSIEPMYAPPKPALSMASTSCAGCTRAGSYCTFPFDSSSETEQDITPTTVPRRPSTDATQELHVMPLDHQQRHLAVAAPPLEARRQPVEQRRAVRRPARTVRRVGGRAVLRRLGGGRERRARPTAPAVHLHGALERRRRREPRGVARRLDRGDQLLSARRARHRRAPAVVEDDVRARDAGQRDERAVHLARAVRAHHVVDGEHDRAAARQPRRVARSHARKRRRSHARWRARRRGRRRRSRRPARRRAPRAPCARSGRTSSRRPRSPATALRGAAAEVGSPATPCGPPCRLPLVCSSSTSSSAMEMRAYGDFAVSFFIAHAVAVRQATDASRRSRVRTCWLG